MDTLTFLTAVAAFLAVVGLIYCLSRFVWVTLFLIWIVTVLTVESFAPDGDNLLAWLGTAVVAVVLVVLSRPPLFSGVRSEGDPKAVFPARREIVIDGTNVLYWDEERADLSTLRGVVQHLREENWRPIVFLDASSRHHLRDRSLNGYKFARQLGLHHKRVKICPAGTEADGFILKYAQERGAPVVSNDRFNDRAEMAKDLKIVKGIIVGGAPMLEGL